MDVISAQCRRAYAAFPNTESLTVVLVAGGTRQSIAAALGLDLTSPVDIDDAMTFETTAWAVRDVAGGALGVEPGGFGDPSLAVLRRLSEGGRIAAVMRSNILAHVRFGCARDGELIFDDDEFRYHVDEPDEVPVELHSLLALADVELWELVGLAMAQHFTGVELEPEDIEAVFASEFYLASNGWYRAETD